VNSRAKVWRFAWAGKGLRHVTVLLVMCSGQESNLQGVAPEHMTSNTVT